MSVYHRSTAKSRILQEYREQEEEIAAALSSQMSPQGEGLESERRVRREIANSNERRRMQSINAGFQLLRSLIPHNEGEKLSKAAILQQTTDYIKTLMLDKAKIMEQNAYFRKLLAEVSRRFRVEFDLDIATVYGESPPRKRKKRDTESSDEGIAADFEDTKYDDFKRELSELRQQLDKERHLRIILENRSPAALDMHQYAEKVYHSEHLKAQQEKEKLLIKFEENEDKNEKIRPMGDEVVPFNPLSIDLEPSDLRVLPDLRIPSSDLRIPSSDLRIPSADHRVPSADHRVPSTDHRVPSASPHRSDSSDSTSSVTPRRKFEIETLVKAIHYVEGEENCTDQRCCKSEHGLSYISHHQTSSVPNSEESEEKDSSITSDHDQDDVRWESSGRDSPTLHQQYLKLQSAQNLQHVSNVQKHSPSSVVVTSSSYMDKYPVISEKYSEKYQSVSEKYPAVTHKYPAVTNVLQGSMAQPQFLYRPAVIVHKS